MKNFLFLGVLCGCVAGDPHQGTAVGNPGNLDVSVGDVPDEISLDRAEIHAADLVLLECSGGVAVVRVQTVLDALAPSPVEIPVPSGTWCGVLLTLDPEVLGQVVLAGTTDGGTTFTLDLNPGSIPLHDGFSVDGTQLLLVVSLGDSVDVDAIEARGAVAAISADDPDAIAWADALGEETVLFEDRDSDGVLSDPDTVLAGKALQDTGGSFDQPLEAQSVGEGQGCGCQLNRATSGWWVLLALVAFRRRRDA